MKSSNAKSSVVQSQSQIECVDLFCGIGGLTSGLAKGGIKVNAGIDVDEDCKFAYEKNNDAQFILKDISSLTGPQIRKFFGEGSISLLAGCAPCQPFSTYSRKSRKTKEDDKWSLVLHFGRLIKRAQPTLVTMENVPQLIHHQVFDDFLKSLKGYSVWWKVVDCSELGIPQTRKRLVLLASKLGSIKLLEPDLSEPSTVRSAIEGLMPLEAGSCDPKDSLHAASDLSDINLRRIRASKPGGTWRDWNKSLLAKCHRKKSGATFPSVYGRMEWDKPSPTITTQCFGFGNGRFGHPEQDRAISLREAALIQTFPSDYCFLAPGEKLVFAKLGRLIGNAVPVKLGEIIANSLITHVDTYRT